MICSLCTKMVLRCRVVLRCCGVAVRAVHGDIVCYVSGCSVVCVALCCAVWWCAVLDWGLLCCVVVYVICYLLFYTVNVKHNRKFCLISKGKNGWIEHMILRCLPVFPAADVISTVEFNHTGDLLATGDKGGRVVIFQRETEVRGQSFILMSTCNRMHWHSIYRIYILFIGDIYITINKPEAMVPKIWERTRLKQNPFFSELPNKKIYVWLK